MRYTNYIIFIGWFILILIGCSEEDDSLNIEEILVSNTWIMDSYLDSDISNEYVEYPRKDEINFFENGKYIIKGLRTIYSVPFYQDTVVFDNLDWKYDEKYKLIDFITYHDEVFLKYDWQIIDINSSRIIVRMIYPYDYYDDYKVLLKAKN